MNCPSCGYEIPEKVRVPLTKKQSKILAFCQAYEKAHNCFPSLQEICQHFDLTAESGVAEHLAHLTAKGWLKKLSFNSPRPYTAALE